MRRSLLFICYAGFVSLGLPDALIGVAWPSVRETFDVSQGAIAVIFVGSGCSYFVSSFFAGRMLGRMSVGALLAGSSALVALAGFDYAIARWWPLFAAGALLHGLGSGAIDSGLNHYVASHLSARHMNWLHACYSLGAMLGPLIMTAMITSAGSWRMGYASVAGVLLALSFVFLATRNQWADEEPATASPEVENVSDKASVKDTLRNRLVQLHIVLFFIYTGLEVAVGQWSFTVLTESRNIDAKTAGFWVTLYWGSILAGRVGFGFFIDRLKIDPLIRISTLAALAGTTLFAWGGSANLLPVALCLSGFGLAVIFPCLMTRTPQRVGKAIAAHAIGFQVGAAMLGAAALPSLAGFIAARGELSDVPISLMVLAAALFLTHEIVLLSERIRKSKLE